jgi:hypothetical protein
MPVYWTIDSRERLFTAVAEGDVTFHDATALLEALSGAGAVSYRKLVDGRHARSGPIMKGRPSAPWRSSARTNSWQRSGRCSARLPPPTGP